MRIVHELSWHDDTQTPGTARTASDPMFVKVAKRGGIGSTRAGAVATWQVMSDEIMPTRPRSRGLLIWAVTATLAAVLFANVALALWVRLRREQAASTDRAAITRSESASRQSRSADAAPASGAFDQLQESDVAGRYRFFDGGVELGKITLLPNHSIINKDGTTYPRYRWEIQSDGILTVWQRGQVILNVMEKPGVYVAVKKDGTESLRIEKLNE